MLVLSALRAFGCPGIVDRVDLPGKFVTTVVSGMAVLIDMAQMPSAMRHCRRVHRRREEGQTKEKGSKQFHPPSFLAALGLRRNSTRSNGCIIFQSLVKDLAQKKLGPIVLWI